MESFTPISGFAGGLLIGLAATVLVVALGRVAGISGIVGGLLVRPVEGLGWRTAFLVGLVAGPLIVGLARGSLPAITLQASWPLMILAGLLVGFGTRLGGGCTSGHGVCGISRGSPRSLTATAVFVATAIATVTVIRHLLGAG